MIFACVLKRFFLVLIIISSSITSINAQPSTITVNVNNVISTVNFRQGVQFDYYDWSRVVDYSSRQLYLDYLKEINCGIVRIFVFRQSSMNPDIPVNETSGYMGPCTFWDSENHTGVFNWVNMDKTIDAIRSIGAEPILVLMMPSSTVPFPRNPRGMESDSNGLPFPDDYAAYCAQYAERYKGKVRFYEVMNEPYQYWSTNEDMSKVSKLLNVYKACYGKIKGADPDSQISFDTVQMRNVFVYMKANNIPFDFYDFHGYGGDDVNDSTNYVLEKAGETFLNDSGEEYSLATMRQKNDNSTMISFCSETNFSDTWMGGTDIRNTQSEGVCFSGLQTIYALQIGLNYRIHYTMSNSKLSSSSQPSGGWGFGMINTDDDSPLLPYYFYRLIGQNLSIGDVIVETKSQNSDIKAVSWIHNGTTKTLAVNIGSASVDVSINYPGEYTGIDDTYYGTKTGTYWNSVTMEPYSVMLTSNANPQMRGYTLTIQPPAGSGTTDPATANYTYPQVTTAFVSAKPSEGWVFYYWFLNGVNVGNTNPLSIPMDKNQTLKAVYIKSNATYLLTLLTPDGSGKTNLIPGSYKYYQIESVNVIAIPTASWRFDHWIVDGSSNSSNPFVVNMNANHTVLAVFKSLPKKTGGFSVYLAGLFLLALLVCIVGLYVLMNHRRV